MCRRPVGRRRFLADGLAWEDMDTYDYLLRELDTVTDSVRQNGDLAEPYSCDTNGEAPLGGTCQHRGICLGGTKDGDPCFEWDQCPYGVCCHERCNGGPFDGDLCDADSDCPDGDCYIFGYCEGGHKDGEACFDFSSVQGSHSRRTVRAFRSIARAGRFATYCRPQRRRTCNQVV